MASSSFLVIKLKVEVGAILLMQNYNRSSTPIMCDSTIAYFSSMPLRSNIYGPERMYREVWDVYVNHCNVNFISCRYSISDLYYDRPITIS